MKTILLNNYAFNLKYAEALVQDVEEEQMTFEPGPGLENHAAFTLGHLAHAAALTVKYLGGSYDFDSEWEKIFRRKGPGDPTKPDKNRDLYPTKVELLEALTTQHQGVERLIRELNKDRLQEPTTWRFHAYMPTLGDLLYFMCISHESMHLGQLAAWRRTLGRSSALSQL